MEIKNTSGYPDATVRRLVEFAYHSVGADEIGRVGQIRVRSKDHGWFSGHATYCTRDIVMSIGSSHEFPLKERGFGKRWPRYSMNDWKEAVVGVMAHEFNHLSQDERERKKGRHIVKSEVECEIASKRAILEYREKEGSNEGSQRAGV